MSILEELHKTNIRVSDIASQYWCERQMEYNYRYGQKLTNAIKGGKMIHEELEGEVNVPIILQPESYPDALYKTVYTSLEALRALKKGGKAREIQLYGSFGGYSVVGKMDQLEMVNGKIVISEDKTRANGNIPSDAQQLTHKVQLMMYRRMLDDLRSGSYGIRNFGAVYKMGRLELSKGFKGQLEALSVPGSMIDLNALATVFFDEFRGLGIIDDTMRIRYLNQYTGDEINSQSLQYSSGEADNILSYVLKYWNGGREAMPVPQEESWKCRFCAFYGNKCKEWWQQKVI